MPGKNIRIFIWLCVLAVVAAWGMLSAQKKDQPAVEKVQGMLSAKGDTWLEVRPDGEKTSRRFLLVPAGFKLDPKSDAMLNGMALGSEVQITAGPDRLITNITMFVTPGGAPVVTGTVTGVPPSGTWYLEIRDDQGRTDRYWPVFKVVPTVTGFDKEMMHAFTQMNVGNRVEIRKSIDDHIRVVTMRLLDLAEHPTVVPGGEGGIVVGQVADKGKDWIVIRGNNGTKDRFVPQRIIGSEGEVDKEVLITIGELAIGQKVEARWFRDGDKRLYQLKNLQAATQPATTQTATPQTATTSTTTTNPATPLPAGLFKE